MFWDVYKYICCSESTIFKSTFKCPVIIIKLCLPFNRNVCKSSLLSTRSSEQDIIILLLLIIYNCLVSAGAASKLSRLNGDPFFILVPAPAQPRPRYRTGILMSPLKCLLDILQILIHLPQEMLERTTLLSSQSAM